MDELDSRKRINDMIEVIMKVAQGDYSAQAALSGNNDELDSLAMGINMMVEDISESRNEILEQQEYSKKRVKEILEVITNMAALNFSRKVSVSNNNDEFDATAACLNMLAEELFSSTVSRSYLFDIISAMVDVLLVLSPDARIVTVNPAATELLGYSEEELLGSSVGMICPEYEEMIDLLLEQASKKGRIINTIEKSVIAKDSREIPVLVSCSVLWDEEGNIKGVVSNLKDITRFKEMEEERSKLETKLQGARRMESLGQLAGGIAHDFNNLLGGISGYADLLEISTDPSLKQYGYIKKIMSSTVKASNLIQQLLTFARKARVDMGPVDLHERIDQVISGLNGSIDSAIDIQKKFGPGSMVVEGDRYQMERAFTHLVSNACDAMPGGGELIFTTEAVSLNDSSNLDEKYQVAPGEYARISISDTGAGMDEEVKKHLFEPFFSTKGVGHGSGLGLASVYGFIKQHKGYITVESRKNRGTTFTLFLPLITENGDREEVGSQIEKK